MRTMGMKKGMAISGKVFGVERKQSKAGKKYQVGSVGIGKKNQDGTWDNGFFRFTLFGDTPIESKEDYTLYGQMQPMKYKKNDGTAVDSFEMVAFEVAPMIAFEAKQEAPKNDSWGSNAPEDDKLEDEIPF